MIPEFNWSPSLIKVWKQCKLRAFCKITRRELDTEVDSSYGDAGTLVHTVLEQHYRESTELPLPEAIQEGKNHLNGLWEIHEEKVRNPKIIKDEYILSVINGIRLKLTPDILEHEFRFSEPVSFRGFADIIDTKKDYIGDWKTSKYKAAKVRDYKEQMKYYAWAYRKEFGRTPKLCWVMFNKSDKIFKWKFSDELLDEVEKELIEMNEEFKERWKTMDFPRGESKLNCFFCPWKRTCSSDFMREKTSDKEEIKLHLKGNKLVIEGTIPELTHKKCEAAINYTVKNAFFITQAMAAKGQKWDGIKRLYKRKAYGADTFIGYLEKVYSILKQDLNASFSIIDHRDKAVIETKIVMPDKLNIEFDWYYFQPEAIKALIRYRWGICKIGTGGGKTAIAAECIRQIRGKTIFIIDNKDLLLQTKEEYEEMLEMKIGIVGLGLREWDNDIILSTIQTLAKFAKEFAPKLAQFNVMIGDESHIWAAKSFEKISKYLINTKYRLCFSATPKRDDGNTNTMFAHCGEVVYSKSTKELIKEGFLVQPKVIFYRYNSKVNVTDNWQSEYQDGIVDNDIRNDLIIQLAKEQIALGKQVMILCTRTAHCKMFLKALGEDARLIFGKTKDYIRTDVRNAFKKGEFPLLIGNLRIFNKGLNIKNLDVIINASANKGETTTVQTIGRPLRNSPGKEEALYIDFIDSGEYLKAHSNSRIKALKEEEHEVVINEM